MGALKPTFFASSGSAGHPKWVALSREALRASAHGVNRHLAARPEDRWQGETGFIHEVLLESYLKDHPAPEDCEYYLCGPPMMVKAVRAMLDNLGVDPGNIFYDDFGG